MDRVIAFGAGAVVAFFFGYLVGVQSSGRPSPEATSGKPDAAEFRGDGSGLLDAKVPKLKSLVDLANQDEDPVAHDLSKAEIKELKTMLLPHFTPVEIGSWRAVRDEYVNRFVAMSQGGPWATGSDETADPRFDAKIAELAEGHYQGRMSFPETLNSAAKSYDFMVSLSGYTTSSPEGRMSVHKSDGTPGWGVQFRWSRVGTNAAARVLYLVIPSFSTSSKARATHLAFPIPVDMDVGKSHTGELVGLNADLNWGRVGTFELLKSK